MEPTTFISVIIPLPDHRGMAIKAVSQWCEEQRYPDNLYEIIVVSDTTNVELEAAVLEKLRTHDSLIAKPGANIPELTNFGVQKASAELLFITESHCLPAPDCLTHLADYFNSHKVDVACCSSDGIDENLLAEMEQRLFEVDFQKRCLPDAWNKITVRGFGIKRSTYLASKGFESQYGHFSEPVFGAHLHALGYQMGYAAKAKVSHYNNPSLKYLLPSLVEYGECKVEYFLQGNQSYAKRYFNADFSGIERELNRITDTRQQYWLQAKRALKTIRINKESIKATFSEILKAVPYLFVGSQWNLLKRLLILKLHQVRLPWYQRNPERFFSIYQKIWVSAIHYGQTRKLMQSLKEMHKQELRAPNQCTTLSK